MDFSQKELEKFKEIAELYNTIKPIILYSEEIDSSSNSNLQVLKEMRDAFDHLIRIISAKTGVTDKKDEEYLLSNIEKSIGHVYRAGFDALDGTGISLKEEITTMLKNYSSDVIMNVIPKYWDIKEEVNEISGMISSFRGRKDSGNNLADLLSEYVLTINRLKEIKLELSKKMSLVNERHNEVIETQKKEIGFTPYFLVY